MPLVSVVIPTYNHAQYVCDTIASVLSQEFSDIEIVVVNDGSPDDTREVLRPLVQNNTIRYFEQANQGQAAARNLGLSKSNGQFVAFLDDDDLWPVDKLSWQVETLQSDDDLVAIGGSVATLGEEDRWVPMSVPTRRLTFDAIFLGCPMTSPGQSLIRKTSLLKSGGFDANIWGADDFDLWFRLALIGPIEMQERVALFYRRHRSNASLNRCRMMKNCRFAIDKNLKYASHNDTWGLRRSANRWLYDYGGTWAVGQLKNSVRRGNLNAMVMYLCELAKFTPAFLKDRNLFIRFIGDLLPSWFVNVRQ